MVHEQQLNPEQLSDSANLVRFGPYQVDRRTGEVRKHGLKIKLSGQPFEVLSLLLERPGEVVTREQLRQRLWPTDIYVDFERSLNTAVKKLRSTLNDDPRDPRYIETLSRKGYRFIGTIERQEAIATEPASTFVSRIAPPSDLLVQADHAVISGPTVELTSSRRTWVVAIGITALIVVSAFLVYRANRKMQLSPQVAPSKTSTLRSSIAVLGFKNLSSGHDADWLSTAITQMLSTELANGGKLRIIPEETVARAKADLALKEKDGYPRETLRALRTDLGSDYVVAGSYVALGDRNSGQVRIDLRVQETISGETLASIAVSGKQSEIFALIARAGQEMRAKFGSTVPPEGDVDWRTVLPSDPEAAKLYSAGLARLRVFENLAASELLQKSVTLEPTFALGHAALSQAWSALGYDARAATSAQKALSLANSLPEDVRLAIEGRYYELKHDWPGAIGAYRHLWQDFPDDLESGLRLVAAQTSSGSINDALATLSSLRSVPASQRDDPRIDLAEASVAARNADYKRQQALAEQAAKKAQTSGARLLLARAQLVRGWALDDQSQLKEAMESYQAAGKIFEEAGDRDGTATALNDLGIVLQKQGDLTGAREKLQQARDHFRQVGDENGYGAVLTNLGEVYRAQGELAPAEDLYREALSIFQKTGRKDNEYATMNDLGGVLYQRGDFRGARKLFENLLAVRQAAGDKNGVAFAKTNLADALRVQGELDRAVGLYEQALATFKEIGDRSSAAAVELTLAKALLSKQDLAAARQALQDALRVNQEIGAKGDAALDRVMLAYVAFVDRHPEHFDASVQSAIEELRSEKRSADEVEARAMQAEVLLAGGKTNAAQETLEKASALRVTDWLATFRLTTSLAKLEAARGKESTAKRKLIAAMTDAEQAGCVICRTEAKIALSEMNGKRQSLADRLP